MSSLYRFNPRELFEIWAPRGGPWSDWAKPAFFAQLDERLSRPNRSGWATEAPAALARAEHDCALVLELPGVECVWMAAALAHAGWAPVPLFNGSPGPRPVVDTGSLANALIDAAVTLPAQRTGAPPCFMLDADRMIGSSKPSPGRFDNRWMTFPQDFPSGQLLLSRGVRRAIVVRQGGRSAPADDLSHVLCGWQDAGVAIYALDLARDPAPREMQVRRPPWYRAAWRRALARAKLRPSAAGGFGGVVPEPSEGGSGFG